MSPIASKEDDPEKPWGFTCSECTHVPPRGEDPDYASYVRHYEGSTPVWGSIALHVPIRCRACDTAKKRWSRMRRRVKAVYTAAESLPGRRYRRPKFLTFGLPSDVSARYEDRFALARILNSRLPRAREVLESSLGVKGGVYVIEITSRLVPLGAKLNPPMTRRCCGFTMTDEVPLLTWKHHAHVHMVAVAPYIPKDDLKEACEALMPMGLGRINLRTMGSDDFTAEEAKDRIAFYVSKYLNKDGGRLRSWGILRNRRS